MIDDAEPMRNTSKRKVAIGLTMVLEHPY